MNNILEQAVEILRSCHEQRYNKNTAAMARELGLSHITLGQWLRGQRKPNLAALAPAFEAMNVKLQAPNTQLLDYEFIPSGPASLSEQGELIITENGTRPLALEKFWLGEKGVRPGNARLIEVTDDTMEPVLKKGSLALVDTGHTTPSPTGIYLTAYLGELAFRKISRRPDGFMLHSLDPYTPDTPAQPEHLTVHGQVILTINPL